MSTDNKTSLIDPMEVERLEKSRIWSIYEAEIDRLKALLGSKDEQIEKLENAIDVILRESANIMNAVSEKLSKDASITLDFGQLEVIAQNPRFAERARELAANQIKSITSPTPEEK